MKHLNLRAAAMLSLVACLVMLAAYAASAGAGAKRQRTVTSGKFVGTFSVTVLQGPEAGKSYTGKLKLTGSRKGRLSGTFAVAGSAKGIPVTGQLHGRLIGLSLAIGPNQTIIGTGVVGYDPATKKNTIGGTASGPSDTAIGVWRYVAGTGILGPGMSPTRRTVGCLMGLPVPFRPGEPQLCYIAD
jgi:hypothetical protein